MKLFFYGGTKSVTGANYILESGAPSTGSGQATRIMVDCGLQQGSSFSERHNWDPFPYDVGSVAAAFVTHAHIDHTGRLAKLVKDGFKGKIYSTPPTRDAALLLLADSDHILADEAERFKLPLLFTQSDIEALALKWQGISYHVPVTVGPFTITLWNAGHILGSSFIEIEAEGKRIIFSGDLGNSPAPLIGKGETYSGQADYCLIESAYGDRIHEDVKERKEILESVIEETIKAGGTIIIPAFAMERTQALLIEINGLMQSGRIPHIPVFLDSPLAIKLTYLYEKYDSYLSHPVRDRSPQDDRSRLAGSERTVSNGTDPEHLFKFPGLRQTLTTPESKAINDVKGPKIIIAGSGMSHGGRILHHEKRYLPDPKSTLLIVGYQAEGSLGRQLLNGVKEVRMFHEDVSVRARIKAIGGYSAHADQRQLLEWLSPMRGTVKKVFVVQGEEHAALVLAEKMKTELGLEGIIPSQGDEVVL